ncbi:MAG: hypothetical protein ACLR17_04810 [Enterobacteriaceae bacterium]
MEKDADGNVTQMYFSGSAVVDFNNSSGLASGSAGNGGYAPAIQPTLTLDNGKTIAAGTRRSLLLIAWIKGEPGRSMKIIGHPLPPAGYESV